MPPAATDAPYRTETIAITIPCYNEAKRLDTRRFRNYLIEPSPVCLVFVDDGSTDDTTRILHELCEGVEHRGSVLTERVNRGKAEAVRRGMLSALSKANRPDIVGFWDADLATPLDAIENLVAVLRNRPGIDMVFGSRVKLLGRTIKRDARRHYLGRVFATVASTLLKLPIYDTQCGAKLFRASSGIERVLQEPFLSRWVFDVEIIARYRNLYNNDPHILEQLIYEYPLEQWEDVAGSKVRLTDFLHAFADMSKIRSKYLKD